MGGSAIGGDFAAEVVGQQGRLISVVRSYRLPGWFPASRALPILVSYSGNTEETLAVADHLGESGVGAAVVTSGGRLAELADARGWPAVAVPAGLPPRAAFGYLLAAILIHCEAAGLSSPVGPALDEAAGTVERILGEATGLVEDLADGLDGRIAVVYGSPGPTAPAAYRWKTQINENAKWPAFTGMLPEIDHNELEGWEALADTTSRKVGIVVLHDIDDDRRIGRRADLSRALTLKKVGWVGDVHAQGNGVLARMLSLVAVGDLLSLALARRAGIDPMPVELLETLKQRLKEDAT